MDCENQAIQYQAVYNVILIIDPYVARDRYGIVLNKTNRDFNENTVVGTIPSFHQWKLPWTKIQKGIGSNYYALTIYNNCIPGI